VVPDRDERLQYGFGSVGFFLNACDGHEIQEPLGAQFTRFNGTKVHILTQKALMGARQAPVCVA
jgi:hypothetical protein